jgi:FkbM family methyltransferase
MLKSYYFLARRSFHAFLVNPKYFFKRVFLALKEFILPFPDHSVFKRINGVMFEFDFSFSDKIKQMYCGSYQPSVAEPLRKYLKKGDTFIDAGANIGYFSAVGAGLVGKEGQVHSFEPVPEYFQRLKKLADINEEYKITVNQLALGEEEKIEKIYIGGPLHMGNNSFFPSLLEGVDGVKDAEVRICRLDKYIEEKNLDNIKLIKIDVEGYELFLFQGLKNYFIECRQKKSFPLIICEICPKAYSSLGYELKDILNYMKGFAYYPFDIFNNKKKIDIKDIEKSQVMDVLFIHQFD